jgi:hypothetical protein
VLEWQSFALPFEQSIWLCITINMGGKKMPQINWTYTSCHGIEYDGLIEIEHNMELPKAVYLNSWRIATVILSDVNDSDAHAYEANYPNRFVFVLRDQDALFGLTMWLKDEDIAPGASIILSLGMEFFNYQGLNPSGAPFIQSSDPDEVVVGADED